ncbi:chalcone isomerase family protein [Cocleimonas sp. KMM 6892]|uniref:chalcone isomerase family protein n=1 Tax=unclassified Cocleimonas TaxID=2639732 RepID=UPI002DB8E3DF|nr:MULTISPECIES: chalcone isomerase family protein [unclassified Cocleimonas]MEB8431576.1 chalcone isomerase family protein [Cocleimonas sp. KMM 6892]MEC4713652.1 chalcone isomerase family protein [Cocleimonas sp. KMM 6895]MEC4742983.1 chalcone isomerase family protein [Cocleimonas sp. KMM 6896]
MRLFKTIFPFIVMIMVMVLSTIFSSAFAYTKQWPLHSKGEVRYLKMIKVYDISLYSPNAVKAETILNTNVSKCLKLDYAVDLSVDKFRLATFKVLSRQHNAEYLEKIKAPLDAFQQAYKPVKKGDSYSLCYNGRNQLMRLDLNDKNLIEIKSAELAKAYLGIWLSKNKPISNPLYRSFFPVSG